MDKKIGIIGYGNMGSAIAERVESDYEVFVFDKDKNKTGGIRGVQVCLNIPDLVKNVEAVILAVKPQDFDHVLRELRDYAKDRLIVSIAAGITTRYVQKALGEIKVVRVMPNLPVKIGLGMSCICLGAYADAKDIEYVKELFDSLGTTLVIDEGMMDAATAIAGSGPGFFYGLLAGRTDIDFVTFASEFFIPEFSRAAEAVGFSQDEAKTLVSAVSVGCVALLKHTNMSAQELCRQVTSEGGTTAAGLLALEKGGSLVEAAKAAVKRAKELSKGG